MGKLTILIGTSCFESVYAKCHLPSLANRDTSHYCYVCECMVIIENQAQFFCKIKQDNNEKFDCTLCEPWIKTLLGHSLKSQEDFKTNKVFTFICSKRKKPKGKFFLSPIAKLVSFCSFKCEKSKPSV